MPATVLVSSQVSSRHVGSSFFSHFHQNNTQPAVGISSTTTATNQNQMDQGTSCSPTTSLQPKHIICNTRLTRPNLFQQTRFSSKARSTLAAIDDNNNSNNNQTIKRYTSTTRKGIVMYIMYIYIYIVLLKGHMHSQGCPSTTLTPWCWQNNNIHCLSLQDDRPGALDHGLHRLLRPLCTWQLFSPFARLLEELSGMVIDGTGHLGTGPESGRVWECWFLCLFWCSCFCLVEVK